MINIYQVIQNVLCDVCFIISLSFALCGIVLGFIMFYETLQIIQNFKNYSKGGCLLLIYAILLFILGLFYGNNDGDYDCLC